MSMAVVRVLVGLALTIAAFLLNVTLLMGALSIYFFSISFCNFYCLGFGFMFTLSFRI